MLIGSPLDPAPVVESATGALLQYGALGVMLLALGWFAWSATQRERLRADKAEEREQKLNEAMRTEVIPVLTKATEAIVRVSEIVPEAVAELRSIRRP